MSGVIDILDTLLQSKSATLEKAEIILLIVSLSNFKIWKQNYGNNFIMMVWKFHIIIRLQSKLVRFLKSQNKKELNQKFDKFSFGDHCHTQLMSNDTVLEEISNKWHLLQPIGNYFWQFKFCYNNEKKNV